MRVNRLLIFLIRVNLAAFVFITLLTTVLFSLAFHHFVPEGTMINSVTSTIENKYYLLVIAVLFAPLIETLFFQFFPIMFMLFVRNKRNRSNLYIAILLSALLMAIGHIYSVYYFVSTFFIGLLWAISYVIAMHRKQNAFLTISLVHALWNLLVFIINYQ